MVANGKGLLAMDESNRTCNERFAALGIAQTIEMRRSYRELLLTTPRLSTTISGIILFDETFWQVGSDAKPFVQTILDADMLVGIKVDTGSKVLAAHADEHVTEGLDGLRDRLIAYFDHGARFAKWRGVIAVDEPDKIVPNRPSQACIEVNSHALARYAALCQEVGLVPIIEPEVLMEGAQTMERCAEVTEQVLRCVFDQLIVQGVLLEAVILKPNMVTAGLTNSHQNSVAEVAEATLQCMRRVVPAAVPGIAFLSGGQSGELASARLNAMHSASNLATGPLGLPWPLTFSFARALQHPALRIWGGKEDNRVSAQQALLHRARCNCAASQGQYDLAVEYP